MYAFMRWSLDRGVTKSVENRQKGQIALLVEGLTEHYAIDPGWKQLADDKKKWIDILWQANPYRFGSRHPPAWSEQALNEPGNSWPPTLPDSPTNRRFKPLDLSVMLLQSDKSIIFGRNELLSQLSLHPIRYQGQTVGFLGVLPRKPITQLIEPEFMEDQAHSFVAIALFMVLLSVGLSLLLAYTLVRPLKRIAAAAKVLAVGQYDVRLPVESGDELGQLARDFNELAAALEQVEQSRRRWVADISHELRTPLAILRGELEALQDGIRPLSREAVDSLLTDVMRLHRLTDDLYQLSKTDQGTLSYRKTQVNPLEILTADLAALSPDFSGKQLHVTLSNQLIATVNIFADPDRLSQLFRNLLNNTINYTDFGGQLKIIVFQRRDKVVMIFSDSSPGVSEQDIPKLFDRFYRVESSRNRHHGGAGLGLAICSNIVEAHHGLIHAQPSALNGLAIHIEIPLI